MLVKSVIPMSYVRSICIYTARTKKVFRDENTLAYYNFTTFAARGRQDM
jgi:hypothetical protein